MKKRIVAGLLSAVMLLGTLTGCGSQSAASDQKFEAGTAAALMTKYNTAEQKVTDDNYRTYYEVFVYSFYDSDGDGIGDLKGITEKLPYIKQFADIVWINPIYKSPVRDGGYDIEDYYAIDEKFGTIYAGQRYAQPQGLKAPSIPTCAPL